MAGGDSSMPKSPSSGSDARTSIKSTSVKCRAKKSVKAKIVRLAFRSDHLHSTGKKLIRPSPGDFKDATNWFEKPEWDISRGNSDPISHTKGMNVKVDIEVEFTVTPSGESASLTKVAGNSRGTKFLTFKKDLTQTVTTQRLPITDLVSEGELPNFVTLLRKKIIWNIVVDGESKNIGTTGPHSIYVTFDEPIGKMLYSKDDGFIEAGPDQDVTVERLRLSVKATKRKVKKDEKECADAIFNYLKRIGVGYVLDYRWSEGIENTTGIIPKPKTLHHYLWRCNANTAKGECHNIAAAFILACKIIGVKGPFEVGYMFPWASRQDGHPTYPKSTQKSSSGRNILGKYNEQYSRIHTGEGHSLEVLNFLDGSGDANNFEGVATYKGNVLYAIGEGIYGRYSDPHDNASLFFATDVKMKKGDFDLLFLRNLMGVPWVCKKPYPWSKGPKFKWQQ